MNALRHVNDEASSHVVFFFVFRYVLARGRYKCFPADSTRHTHDACFGITNDHVSIEFDINVPAQVADGM